MRVIALFIDNVVIVSLVVLIWGLFYALGIDNPDSGDDPSGVTALAILIIYFLYSPVLIGIWSTTIGKRALGLYVVRSNGARCGFWRALGRQLAQILSAILFGIGYLMVAFREDKRALHDLIADTAVVHRYQG